MPSPLTRFGGTLDALTVLKDSYAVTASAAATVGYELLCAVAPRVPCVTSDLRAIDLEL